MTIGMNNPAAAGAIPFRLAQAYGVAAPTKPAPTGPIQTQPAAAPQTTHITQTAAISRPTVGGDIDANAARVTRLIGAVVPGKVDFSGDTPRQESSLPLYRHPADKNTAATGVQVGRVVDLTG